MATNEIGVRVTLEGERQYNEQMRQITQNTKLAAAEAKQLESEWGKASPEKSAAQVEQLNQQIERQAQAVDLAKQNVERYAAETGEGSSQTLKWKTTLAQAETELARLRGELDKVPNSLQIYGQKLQETGQKIKKVGSAITSAGRTMSTYVTAPIVAVGAAAVKTTADFDTSMSKVMALSGATGDEFQALRDKARQMGASTKFSATESADALSYMALAGWDTDQMLEGLDGVMNLAAASGMDLAEASDLVTDYLTAFGLEAKDSSKMADELAYAQAHSNTTTTQLGEAFGNSASMMHSAGQSMETTTAILESFANQGMKGSEAGTALSAMMRDIIQKMKNGKIYIGDTAIQVQDANGNFRDMTDILADVETATEGMGTAEKDAALMTTFTSRSIKGVNMVLNEGVGSVKKYREELYKADGTAKSMADIMQDNLAGQLKILGSQLQELAISFGDILIPHVRKAVEWIQEQVDKFNALDKSTKEQIVKFGALAAAIGPVLLIGGKLVTSIGSIVTGAGKAIEWLGKLSGGFGGLAGALGPVIGAFGLAAGAGALLGFAIKDLNEKYGATSEINDFNNYVRGTADAANEARDNLEKSTEEIKRTSDNAAQVMEECELSAELTDRYAEELYELAEKTNRTADEQRRMEAIIGILNDLYPGFTEAVMDSNGELKMGTSELKEYVAQLKNTAKIKALQSIIEEYGEKIADAAKKQIEAEHALSDSMEATDQAAAKRDDVTKSLTRNAEEATQADQKRAKAIKDTTFNIEEANQADYEHLMAVNNLRHGYVDLDGETVKASDTIEQLSDSINIGTNEQEKLTGALEESETAVNDLSEEQAGYQKELEDLISSSNDYIDAQFDSVTATGENADAAAAAGDEMEEYADDVEDAAETIEEANQKIRDSYEDTKQSAKDSTLGQKSLWEELEKQEGTSLEKMLANLRAHNQAMENWSFNASTLIHSTEYATDEGFRNMVNHVIQGKEDLAPELQELYNVWANNKEDLAELVSEYGFTESNADRQAEILAYTQSVIENGLELTNQALESGVEDGQKRIGQIFSNPKGVSDGIRTGMSGIVKLATKEGKVAGKAVPEGVAAGERSGKGDIQSASGEMESETLSGIGSIVKLAIDSITAGLTISKGIAAGMTAGVVNINTASSSVKAAIQSGISGVSGLQTSAKSAGTSVAHNIKSGLESENISGAMSTISSTVRTGIQAIESQKTSAKTAGSTIGSELAAGLDGKQTDVTSAGRRLGDAAANGVGSASGNAQTNGRKVINAAADELKKYENSQEPWTWGRHLGDNFANGLGSAYGNVIAQARQIANAVQNILGHSTPKEGPLVHDDVWGLHLGQNFAKGMEQSIPAVESAALGMANAAAMIPTTTTLDIDAMSGRNVAVDALTPMNITEAFIAAAENIDWRVMIGSREFGRILREQGVYA